MLPVWTLARGWFPAGPHEARWDGRDEGGAAVAAGIYFVRVESGGAPSERLKLILLK